MNSALPAKRNKIYRCILPIYGAADYCRDVSAPNKLAAIRKARDDFDTPFRRAYGRAHKQTPMHHFCAFKIANKD